ncbi:Hexosaminidase D [Brachionus plicatilis]|uniref:beta-N-acetylhexosaminidase n=1 Tax=Brachionus plicatilis TaxID=10195 RepID=A0A3M7SYU6_BRAPC|nr:Hexosaminidase D [Brachionus plicatilis]
MYTIRRRQKLRFWLTIGLILLFIFFFLLINQTKSIEDSDRDYHRRRDSYRKKVKEKYSADEQVELEQENNEELKDGASKSELARTMKSMQKLVHLDLKGSPPKLNYLKELIPFMKKSGATGVIIEYEDFFPYKDDLESVTNQNHYTNQELKQIFDLLKQNQMSLIPLIQTYGHMEFVLKLKQFSHLRESPEHYQVITPCLNESYSKVLYKMIDQILEIHPEELEYIHIGCDEVFFINQNDACKKMPHLQTTKDFFIYHVTNLVNYVKSKRPNLGVMIWEDMIRRNMLSSNDYSIKTFAKKIVPVVWNYKAQVEIDSDVFRIYDDLFSEIWFASAFKGATRHLEIIPNAELHHSNHLSWLSIIRNFPSTHKIKGMILTGWSRYDHMQAVCEILPASLPSMTLCLQTLLNYQEENALVFEETKKILNCDYSGHDAGFLLDPTSVTNFTKLQVSVQELTSLYKCDFPGAHLYNWLLGLRILIHGFETKHAIYSEILNSYNLKNNFFNTIKLKEAIDFMYPMFKTKFIEFLTLGEKEFDKLFYTDLYEEISAVYVQRYVSLIEERLTELNKTKIPESAPIRPLNKINKLDVAQSVL